MRIQVVECFTMWMQHRIGSSTTAMCGTNARCNASRRIRSSSETTSRIKLTNRHPREFESCPRFFCPTGVRVFFYTA